MAAEGFLLDGNWLDGNLASALAEEPPLASVHLVARAPVCIGKTTALAANMLAVKYFNTQIEHRGKEKRRLTLR